LQGLVTTDVGRVSRDGIAYGAILTPQGRYLADLFLVSQDGALLVDAPRDAAEDLLRRLTLYRLRARVEIALTDLSAIRGLGPVPEGAQADPRAPGLGWRAYGPGRTQGDAIDWAARHVAERVPVHGADLVPNESYILELDFPRLQGVDFRKGCYVGQEVTARMHHKTELKKGLVRVALDGPAAPGAPITTADGREAGRLGTVAGNRALALVRFDRADGVLQAQEAALRVAG
jgi:folate-binding protein YgfZ